MYRYELLDEVPRKARKNACIGFFHEQTMWRMVGKLIHDEGQNAADVGVVTERLGFGIKCCEVALSSASTRAWEHKIKNAQKAHYTALRFVNRFRRSGHEAHRINQRMTHLKTRLDKLN